jgi:hypothetical protein
VGMERCFYIFTDNTPCLLLRPHALGAGQAWGCSVRRLAESSRGLEWPPRDGLLLASLGAFLFPSLHLALCLPYLAPRPCPAASLPPLAPGLLVYMAACGPACTSAAPAAAPCR